MQWILAFHIIFVVCWFAGLFYLPRLFVYHSQASLQGDAMGVARFKTMERKLLNFIMTPSAILATIFGVWLLLLNPSYYFAQGWMHAKLSLVVFLWVYHVWCIRLTAKFKRDNNPHSEKFYRWFNEVPAVLLIAIVILVVVKP